MSLNEALSEGLMVTFVGLVIVFSVLVILMLIMMAMKKVFYREEPKKTVKEPVPVEAVETVANNTSSTDDTEIIVVIAAAIAASMNTSPSNLKIRSFRRIGNLAPDWNREGLRDTINSRF